MYDFHIFYCRNTTLHNHFPTQSKLMQRTKLSQISQISQIFQISIASKSRMERHQQPASHLVMMRHRVTLSYVIILFI